MTQLNVRPNAEIGTTIAKMENLVKSFNEMMKDRARVQLDSNVIALDQITDHDGKECKWCVHFSVVFDFGYYYESEWIVFAWKQGKVTKSVAIDYYRENRKKFITDRKMSNFVNKLIHPIPI